MRALFGPTPARVRVAALRVRAGCLQAGRDRVGYFWCTAPHRMDMVAAAGSSPPPRASSLAQCAACRRCESTICVRPARVVQKSNRHAGRDTGVHAQLARRRALDRCARPTAACFLRPMVVAAGSSPPPRTPPQPWKRCRPTSVCEQRHRSHSSAAPVGAVHDAVGSLPSDAACSTRCGRAGLLDLSVSLSSLAVPPQSNDCSHGRPRVSQAGLARSATAPGALRALFRHFWSNRKNGDPGD